MLFCLACFSARGHTLKAMKKHLKLSRSARKCIRCEKAKIRQGNADLAEVGRKIVELYARFGVKRA